MLKNLSGIDQLNRVSHHFSYSGDSCYINSLTERTRSVNSVDHLFAINNFKNVIVTYEDVSDIYCTDFSLGYERVAVIRDIVNIIASRLKLLENRKIKGKSGPSLVDINDKIFEVWLQLCSSRERGCLLIKFEDWVANKSYRSTIADYFGVKNIDIRESVAPYGGGSSFTGTSKVPSLKELQARAGSVIFPEIIARKLNSSSVLEARKALGYI